MLKYLKKTEKTAKSAEEAKELALAELGIAEEDAVITVTDEGSKGFLGIGSKGVTVSAEAKNPAPIIVKTFLSQVFDAMGLDVEISAKVEDDTVFADMSGDSMGLVIGKRGDTLDALQYLTSLIVNHETDDRTRVILDTENYREKRHTALVALANRLADKVARTGRKHTLEPMNPYERRIIHSCLQPNDRVTTFSIDEEPRRRIVIAPTSSRPSTTSTPHIPAHIASEYRQQNHNKAKNFDEFLAENGEL